MHVIQLFGFLFVRIHIEIVETRLPELEEVRDGIVGERSYSDLIGWIASQLDRDLLFEDLDSDGRGGDFGFGDKQMDMVGHDYVADQREILLDANFLKFCED